MIDALTDKFYDCFSNSESTADIVEFSEARPISMWTV
jgi:hypothetical protein